MVSVGYVPTCRRFPTALQWGVQRNGIYPPNSNFIGNFFNTRRALHALQQTPENHQQNCHSISCYARAASFEAQLKPSWSATATPSSFFKNEVSSFQKYNFFLKRERSDSISLTDQRRCFSSSPTGGEEGIARSEGMIGSPTLFIIKHDRPGWQPLVEDEHEVIPRDEFGVPATIPPEVSSTIRHVYHVPPQFYPFLKKLGDDTPELQPYMEKLLKGGFTFNDYEEMFYKFAKPLKIYRNQIPLPYRTAEEQGRHEEVNWESAWHSYRQRVLSEVAYAACPNSSTLYIYFRTHMYAREYLMGILIGVFFGWLWVDAHRQYRIDMKLFYLEAPEHKINWVKPRGDLI
ncbi:hypothetical protein IE077_002147 [Cardiosporidium cionae]|uniref:Transmembrane protein n=1 Tax=Cardiosporidium cionae TaxID=476202 RepID=A0ABQ7JBE8_9APIC|nr:hypothetical protein IE077_002147 [Cardiosporidium cionae]|eukprot:KAF8821330.1 hypothetical protein IE077_002147 [Cardiosporidium cionae]